MESEYKYKHQKTLKEYDFYKSIRISSRDGLVLAGSESNDIDFFEVTSAKGKSYQLNNIGAYRTKSILHDFDIISGSEEEGSKSVNIAYSAKDVPVQIKKYAAENWPENLYEESSYSITAYQKSPEEYINVVALKHIPSHNSLFAAGKKLFSAFDLEKANISYKSKCIKKTEIVSCFDIHGDNPQLAAIGNFTKKIALLDLNEDKIIQECSVHAGGMTFLKFAPGASNYLFSGARKDNSIYCWDTRKMDAAVSVYERKSFTNQRMEVEIDAENRLYLGNDDGTIVVYDITTGSPVAFFEAGGDVVNCVKALALNSDKSPLLVNTMGSRKFYIPEEKTKDKKSNQMAVEGETSSESDFEEEEGSLFYDRNTQLQNPASKELQLWKLI